MTAEPIAQPSGAGESLTPDLAAQIVNVPACEHCGGRHARACPRVKRMAWHENGRISEVEFWPDGRWSDAHVLWDDEPADTQPETTS